MTNEIVQHLTLELTREVTKSSLAVKKYDTNTRKVIVTLTNSTKVVELKDVAFAVIIGTKPDGKELYNDCVINGNSVQFVLTTQMINVAGDAECEIQITWKDGSVLTTPTFNIHVYDTKSVGIESQNEYNGIIQAMAEAVNAAESAGTAAEQAQVSAETVVKSEKYAGESAGKAALSEQAAMDSQKQAEALAAIAAEKAFIAEEASNEAQEYMNASAESAAKAEASANSAAGNEEKCAEYRDGLEEAVAFASSSASAASESAEAALTSESNAKASETKAKEYLERFGEGQLILGETETTAYRGDRGKIAYEHSNVFGNPHATSYVDVGADEAGAAESALNVAKQYSDSMAAGVAGTVGTLEDLTTENKVNVVAAVNEAAAIARGRCSGYVFDSTEDMETWLADSANTANLKLGDNLYIRAVGVPDYWWDGSTVQILETQKVDMTEYEQALSEVKAAMGYPV